MTGGIVAELGLAAVIPALTAGVALTATGALAHGDKAGTVEIDHPRSRATAPDHPWNWGLAIDRHLAHAPPSVTPPVGADAEATAPVRTSCRWCRCRASLHAQGRR